MEIANTVYSMVSADYLAAHPDLAILIAFMIAFGEALLVIGLFVPSTVVLVGAGTLVGAGHLDFWPVFIATAVGCIAGDQVSYWAGRWYGDRLKLMWPLRSYPQLVQKGEDYIRLHGGKSIAIGRFVPGIKAVIPGIVGMLRMNQMYFLVVNVLSGILWALAHIAPGILIGRSLAFAGELSERLLVVLLALLVILAIAGWLVRLAVGSLAPSINKFLWLLSHWFSASRRRWMRRLGLALRPNRPRAHLILLFAVFSLAALLLLTDMVSGLFIRDAISNLDLSVNNMMAQLRSAPGDQLMIPLTMLGDASMGYVICAAIVAWLLWRRAYRPAIAVALTFLLARGLEMALKHAIGRPRPAAGAFFEAAGNFSFPSGHAVTSGVAFGMLAIVASQNLGRWSKAIVIAACSSVAIAVSFSRIYLGVHWLSDVIGGLLIALLIVTLFGIALEAFPVRRLRPLAFLATLLAVTVGFGAYHISDKFAHNLQRYAQHDSSIRYSLADWLGGKWDTLARKRIDLAGTPEEPFVAQWNGTLADLRSFGESAGWHILPVWHWGDSLTYLDDTMPFDKLPPRPVLHEGLSARLTAVVPDATASGTRLVVRAYQTNVVITAGNGVTPLYLISLTRERLHSRKHLFALPVRVAPVDEKLPDIFATIQQSISRARVIQPADGPVLITLSDG